MRRNNQKQWSRKVTIYFNILNYTQQYRCILFAKVKYIYNIQLWPVGFTYCFNYLHVWEFLTPTHAFLAAHSADIHQPCIPRATGSQRVNIGYAIIAYRFIMFGFVLSQLYFLICGGAVLILHISKGIKIVLQSGLPYS